MYKMLKLGLFELKQNLVYKMQKLEVVEVETQVNNGANDDEVKEHDEDANFSDHSESDPDYAYVSPEDDGQSSDTSNDSYHSKEFQSLPNSDAEGDTNSKIVYPQYYPRSCFGQVHLEVGMEFDTIKMFIEVVRDYTIFLGRDLKWVKFDNIRARACCKQIGCP